MVLYWSSYNFSRFVLFYFFVLFLLLSLSLSPATPIAPVVSMSRKSRTTARVRRFFHTSSADIPSAHRSFRYFVTASRNGVYCLCLSIKLDFPTAFKLFVSYLSFTGFDFLPSLALECALDMREWDYASKMVIVTLLPLACYVAIGTAAIS